MKLVHRTGCLSTLEDFFKEFKFMRGVIEESNWRELNNRNEKDLNLQILMGKSLQIWSI